MALFKKKEKGEEEAPKFPELPKLPELPEIKEEKHDEPVPQLPSFPSGSLGDKFSQNTIKEAVTGKKEEGERADESAEEEMHMMPKPPVSNSAKMPIKNEKKEPGKPEPIFIRIDRFEEGSQVFEQVKKQVTDIEKMFADVAKIKQKEDKELVLWEAELKEIKEKIEKIDENIFSKHE